MDLRKSKTRICSRCVRHPLIMLFLYQIMEGIASVAIGVMCFFTLPDSPGYAKLLSNDEARVLELIHASTRGVKPTSEKSKKRFRWSVLWQVVTDWQLYLQAMVFMSNAVPNYGLKFTMPQIMANMGFESTRAQLLVRCFAEVCTVSLLTRSLDRTSICLRRYLRSRIRLFRRQSDLAHALHRRRPIPPHNRLLDPLRQSRRHRQQRRTLLLRHLRRLHRNLPHPSRLQRLDHQQPRWR